MAKLSWLVRAGYSVGHVLNDLCAACWFSYLLLYLQQVQGLSGTQAGAVLFSGQLADALATPLVGLGSDATRSGLPAFGLGKRKIWNAGGVLLVAISFTFIFGVCLGCDVGEREGGAGAATLKTVTFSLAAAFFNFGWASVQVSHMAMVPELTTDENERVLLNSSRYAFTVLSNVAVFLVVLGLLQKAGAEGKYEPVVYSHLAWIVLALGGVCSLFFLWAVQEKEVRSTSRGDYASLPEGETSLLGEEHKGASDSLSIHSPSDSGSDDDRGGRRLRPPPSPRLELTVRGNSSGRKNVMTWRDWLSVLPFFQVMVVYACVRLAVNVSQVYLTFYVVDTLSMPPEALASVPLICYVAQLLTTLTMKRLAQRLGRRRALTAGAMCTAVACGLLLVITPATANAVYPTVFLLGVGCASSMVITVSVEGDLVGPNTESGAFVYGFMSFADKLVNGLVILAIQAFGDDRAPPGSPDRAHFIRIATGLVPLCAAVVSAMVSWTITFPKALEGSVGTPTVEATAGVAPGVIGRRPAILRSFSFFSGGMTGAGARPGPAMLSTHSHAVSQEMVGEGLGGGGETAPFLSSGAR
jgi:Na+/melibiose symporter-like transporter